MNKRKKLIRPSDRQEADINRGIESDPDSSAATHSEWRRANRLDAGSADDAVANLYRLSRNKREAESSGLLVVQEQGGWRIKNQPGLSGVTKVYKSQKAAIAVAREIASSTDLDIVVHGRDGKVRGRFRPVITFRKVG